MYKLYLSCFATGLHVTEVAHDYQSQVTNYVSDDLKLMYSYDTWHGKNYLDSWPQVYTHIMDTYM